MEPIFPKSVVLHIVFFGLVTWITVRQTASIESKQGMGIRSVSSEMGPEKHLIIFNGDSDIVTLSGGSWEARHAVYAGT